METINEYITQVTALVGAPLLVVFLIALGYGLKATPVYPNRFIPHAVCLLGALLAPMFIGYPPLEKMPHRLVYPEIAAAMQVHVQGFLLAALSWLSHAQILRRLIDSKILPAEADPEPAPTPQQQLEAIVASVPRADAPKPNTP